MNMTRLAIRRPIGIIMLVGAFLLLGVLSYFRLPAELNPAMDFPTVTITTTYPGTNPQEMETLVTKPIEDSISGVTGLKQLSSTSQAGTSVITCTFYFGMNLDTAAANVRQKVDAVRQQLPSDVNSPSVNKENTSSKPVITVVMKGNRSPRELRLLADNVVKDRLSQAADVAEVDTYGGDQREIHVGVRRDRLAAYGINVSQLATAIQNADTNVSTGYIQSGPAYYSLRFLGEFATVDEIRNLRISIPAVAGASASATSAANSSPFTGATTALTPNTAALAGNGVVKLSDVADVSDASVERTQESTLDTQDAVTLTVQKTSDGNTLIATDGVKLQLKAVKKFLPTDVGFVIAQDDSEAVHDNLNDVEESLLLGAILAVLVVYIFLHNFRATVIVAIAIPTCLIATFLLLGVFHMTLNSMTLLGLSLAIGILIDDSIVVLENIVRHLQAGQSPAEAAYNGRSEIGLAAITLTAVDLVVFIPIAFMNGVIGEFFRSFAVSISCAVLPSLFVSFTLTPMLASRWFQQTERFEGEAAGKPRLLVAFDRGYSWCEHRYEDLLRSALRRPWIMALAGNIALFAVLIVIVPQLGFTFAPEQDQGIVALIVESPPGSSLSYTKGITDQIEARIRADKALNYEVKNTLTLVGQDQQGATGTGNTGTQYANVQVNLYPKRSPLDYLNPFQTARLRPDTDAQVAARIRTLVRTVPGATIQSFEVNGFTGISSSSGTSGGAPVEIDLTGADQNQLLAAAQSVKSLLAGVSGVYNTDLSFKASQPEVQIRLDRNRAAEYGLNVNTVAQAVSDAMQGNNTAKFRDPTDSAQNDIRVQLSYADRNSIYRVNDVAVAYQSGHAILLGDVANITLGAGPTRVDRLDRLREISVTGYLQPGTEIGNVQRTVTPKLDAMAGSGSFGQTQYQWGGAAQSISEESPYLILALLLGVLLSYMLMASLFNNLFYPLSIMLTMPQALVGALVALYIANTPLSLIAAIGIVMLNGIATKNAILMIDFTNTLRERGYRRLDAILEAAPARLRPILMTSLCIVFATLPTALALGRGAGFRQPLGITVVGGVLVSTFLTLFVIPSTYVLFDDLSNWMGRRVARRQIPEQDFDVDSGEPLVAAGESEAGPWKR
jgi:HAE1 family hydrophobic/amphiphilic exporter-1